jgi:hypothetical protein
VNGARLLYARAAGCSVCVEKHPLAVALAARRGLPLEVLELDTDEGRARAEPLRLATVPTLALVQDGRARFRLVGRMITEETAEHLLGMYGFGAGAEETDDR